MAKLKNPLASLRASGTLGNIITFVTRGKVKIAERKPEPKDARSEGQLAWRHMFNKCVDLWHELSVAEKQEWESAARPRHMTGYAWYISQCLRPNPGIYLPLQGGTMSGDIDMAKNRLLKLPAPTDAQEPARKAELDALVGGYTEGARVYHTANQSIPNGTLTTLAFYAERYDTDGIHSPTVNNSRLTCKTAGKYGISVTATWAVNVAGFRSLQLKINGTTVIAIQAEHGLTTEAGHQELSTIYALAVGEFMEVIAYQTSGVALNVITSANFSPEFMMQRIG